MRLFFTLLELQPILLRLTFERSAQFTEDGTPTQVAAPPSPPSPPTGWTHG